MNLLRNKKYVYMECLQIDYHINGFKILTDWPFVTGKKLKIFLAERYINTPFL